MGENILKIRGLRAGVDGKEILHGVDLSVGKGETHVLLGPNGSGKTTLMNVLMGHPRYEVYEGDAAFEGEELFALPTHERARRGLFLSFQTPEEIPGVTVENMLRTARQAATGKKVGVNAKTAQRFKEDALCFYRPLPSRKLTFKDLLVYMKGCIAPGNITLMAMTTLAVTLIGLIAPKLSKVLTGPVLESGDIRMLAGIAVFLVATVVSKLLIGVFKDLVLGRLSTKTSVAVEAAVMMRLMTLPA
ncbi:MAG: ATP-binding cassette domain-containing protein, partial [Schwartzia sp.]|nr:ATP-binding cassette domain-containing protein [Schwartzia sp. (in: firmicutes)]